MHQKQWKLGSTIVMQVREQIWHNKQQGAIFPCITTSIK